MKSYTFKIQSIALLVPFVVLSACSSGTSNTPRAVDNEIVFEPCDDAPELDCGVFDVPLIHDSTDNRQISINVTRMPGIGEGPHEPLLLNIDGLGSGTQVLKDVAGSGRIPVSILESYDIIGFDQRGVSDPLRVDCDMLGDANSIRYPRDQGDVMTLVADFTPLADACSAEYSDQLQWVGSNAVVQDMDLMRSMLNAPKLNIIGASFGTRIAALYLGRYPDASGRVILDAPVRPNGKIDTLMLDTTDAQQGSFELMLDACGTTLPDCDRAEVETAFVARVNTLLDDGDLNVFNAFFNLLSTAVSDSETGELLAPLLIDYAISGDPTDLIAVIQDFGLDEEDEEDRLTLERAVFCADDAARPNVDSLLTRLETLNESSDIFAEEILPLAASCVGWPEALDPVSDIRTAEAPASLVIGGNRDVNTPISWAVETADAIGGVFIESGHSGHTTLFVRENDCVDSMVVDFLLDGTLPPTGTVCN